jgi:hypothetical protein
MCLSESTSKNAKRVYYSIGLWSVGVAIWEGETWKWGRDGEMLRETSNEIIDLMESRRNTRAM